MIHSNYFVSISYCRFVNLGETLIHPDTIGIQIEEGIMDMVPKKVRGNEI